jgi:hypothetical protein
MEELILNDNAIGGPIPRSFKNMAKLQKLYL